MIKMDEIPIEIGGKRYRFVLGTYGLKQLELMLGQPWPKIFQGAADGWGAREPLAVFHAGLLTHHETLTERQASLLLDEVGLEKFGEILMQAFKAHIADDAPRPPQPTAPTGNGIGSYPHG